MPIPRTNHNWIPREAETEFQNLLNDGKAYVLPLVGVGGAGKTSLLRRFFSYCERYEVPALYIDLPRLTATSALDMWLRVEAVHTKTFDEQRKKLNTSHETLTAMLQTYGDNASGAAELLQKSMGKDENYGLAIGAAVGAGKLVHEFWQRKENQQQQTLLQKPEESLLLALAKDFSKRGVILVDTLEQAGKQNLQTRLSFRDDGELETPVAENPHATSLLEYCAGMAHFLFDKAVVMVLAGRPPAIRELGGLPVNYFAPTVEVPAFTAEEIRAYLEKSLPRHIASPQESDIKKLQQLTHGNPFLLDRVVRLLADWHPVWEWKAEQWQPLLDNYQHDDRHGLLLYVTQRLLTHVLPNDRAFWRLALPRQYVHREMADILFPLEEFGDQSGLQRLHTYEDKGLVYREQSPNHFFLHDETRTAITAWAKQEKVWLDKPALAIHAQLATWFDQQSAWPQEYPDPMTQNSQNSNPLLLEGAYHTFMADPAFEQREQGQDKEGFWSRLAGSPYRSNAWKRQRIDLLPTEEPLKTTELLDHDWKKLNRFHSHTSQYLIQKAHKGTLPFDWQENESTVRELLGNMPNDPEVWGLMAKMKSLSIDERERHYLKILELVPNNPEKLGDFAIFMHKTRKDFDRAEVFYQQAIDADPKNARLLGSFAWFMHNTRKNFDRAETLYQQAIDADPTHALSLSSFALFMENIRKDFDRAETLYQQAIDAAPTDVLSLSSFALFMENIRKNFDRAETLYQQAIDAAPKSARLLGSFAWFMHNTHEDFDRAETLYQQAIDADPTHALNLSNFALFMHYTRKDFDRAEILYQQAIDSDPTNTRILGSFAWFMHNIRKNFDRAETLYQQTIDTDPTDALSLSSFALFMENIRKNFDRAETLYQQAIDVDPAHSLGLNNFASFMENIRKDFDRAETLHRRAIDANPNSPTHLGNFGVFFQRNRRDYSSAKYWYQKAIDNQPLDYCIVNLAQIHLLEGNYQLGHETLEKGFKLDSSRPLALLLLWLYRFIHFDKQYPQAQMEVMSLLKTGLRSEGWDYSDNIMRAEKDGHPNIPLLKTLVNVISGKAELESLGNAT